MNILNVQDLHKSYGSRVVFDGVSFAIDEDEKVGFIGANGSGNRGRFEENTTSPITDRQAGKAHRNR